MVTKHPENSHRRERAECPEECVHDLHPFRTCNPRNLRTAKPKALDSQCFFAARFSGWLTVDTRESVALGKLPNLSVGMHESSFPKYFSS